MSAFLERIGVFARSPDPRPLAEIAADIDDELAFHVEESTRALAEEGLDADAARAEALRRFGDHGRIRRACVRTQMGERLVLQRIQIVMTTVLVAAVGLLLWSNHEARASMSAERAENAALMTRLEAQIALVGARAATPERNALDAPSPIDRRPARTPESESLPGAVEPPAQPPGDYARPDGTSVEFEYAANAWRAEFDEQGSSWRHGLKTAERLAALPGVQGVEILASIWRSLAVEHREQAMKPFVFDGGSPHALEVLQLGFDDDQTSVKERAVLYLYTYAWKNLWRGETTGGTWFAAYRDLPVADVLTENVDRWARELGDLFASYEQPTDLLAGDLLDVASNVDVSVFAKNGIDLGAILERRGLGSVTEASLGSLTASRRAAMERVLGWCR